MRLREALTAAASRLAAVSETPRLDAELLAAHLLNIDRNTLILSYLDGPAPAGLSALVDRRMTSEPIAYILCHREFWTLDLKVVPGVLIPRPDSETLIEAALKWFGPRTPATILDLGTGSGALLLAALSEFPEANGTGVDQSPTALAVAAENAVRCGLQARAQFRAGNWGEGVDGPFDLILCNPPYISTKAELPATVAHFEPGEALFAGADGLDDYRVLAPQIARLISKTGCAAVEIGFDQAQSAGTLFRDAGLSVVVRPDLGGRDRCLLVTKSL
jgi:release factor glutamine methyltransferase